MVFLSRGEIAEAWGKLGDINLFILALLIPAQILMYFAAGQVYFSYLRAKKQIRRISTPLLMRISLEMNFVNHVIPSGGVSGLGYLAWRLRGHGVTAGQAAMMQVVRYGSVALATTVIMLISSVVLAIIGTPFWVVAFSAGVALAMVIFVIFFVFIISSKKRIATFGRIFRYVVNSITRLVTFGKISNLLSQTTVNKFLGDLNRDYKTIMQDKKMLRAPFAWSIFYSLCDSGTFWITFFALGASVNFAPVVIAQGLASIVGTVVITPGGAGFFEASMVAYFTATGISPDVAIAATLVTRVAILLGTIVSGWGFYQLALIKSKDKALNVK